MTSSKKLESLKFAGGSKLMKELQRTVFFAAYDSAIFCSGNSVTEEQQKALLHTSILGSDDPDELTLPEQMVLGINQFQHFYEDVPVSVNADDRNASAVADAGFVHIGRNYVARQSFRDCCSNCRDCNCRRRCHPHPPRFHYL